MIHQDKLRLFNVAPRFKNGLDIPRTFEYEIQIYKRNGNIKFQDATDLKLQHMRDYQTFRDKGHHIKTKPPDGYKKIRVHLVFNAKHDDRHEARLVADGHLTGIRLESVSSGVVRIHGFHIVLLLVELNNLNL
jgi:hypothetical protein